MMDWLGILEPRYVSCPRRNYMVDESLAGSPLVLRSLAICLYLCIFVSSIGRPCFSRGPR